jgi:Domain of unknown function (DUF4185)/Secretion system C-terminal sorting domain
MRDFDDIQISFLGKGRRFMNRIITNHVINYIIFLILLFPLINFAQSSPYPNSDYITGITYNWTTYIRLAPGSDNWPVTWADDDNQYSAWGDGGGFGGTNDIGRVSLGVARIEGTSSTYTGYNVWGGYHAENPDTVSGKSRGIICIGGVLFMWVGPGSLPVEFNESRLYTSTDHGATWVKNTSWAFFKSDSIIMPCFLQFGKNFANARDNYTYIYAPRYVNDVSQIPGKIDLMRVPKTQIMIRASYEFFNGFDPSGNPKWTSDLKLRLPVFEDANGVGGGLGVSVMYNPGLNRYILIVEHGTSSSGNIGMFEAPEPWGPWKTIAYESKFGNGHVTDSTFYWNISPKWLSSDGKNFVLIFSGVKSLDSWNTVEASFTTNTLPVELLGFNCRFVYKSIELNWVTSTEINNYGFEIERKNIFPNTKESHWTKIGFVVGHGNSNSPKSYNFVDIKPFGGDKYAYRLKQIDNDGKFTYSDSLMVEIVLNSFGLDQNYPNPFNPTTTISYSIPNVETKHAFNVQLKVYDLRGRVVTTLVDKEQVLGNYEVGFNASGLPSGIYFYKLTYGSFNQSRKMILLK